MMRLSERLIVLMAGLVLVAGCKAPAKENTAKPGSQKNEATVQADAPKATETAPAETKPAEQAGAAEKKDTEAEKMAKVSYAIGHFNGSSFKKESIAINAEEFFKGLKDGLAGVTSRMTEEEVRNTLQAFSMEMREKAVARMRAQAEENKKKGEEFLKSNASKEGIKTTSSGLQYKVISEGTGQTPKATDTVKVHYSGRLIDGTEFDSSYKRNEPVEFPVSGVIPGWTEALQMMKTGSKYQLFIPANLAYGENAPPSIGPNQVLIFDVELLEILKPEEPEKSSEPAPVEVKPAEPETK
jgi:FKBP-type peptidyl-prolyl cis-trans isomerase